ncbi:MAG: hypothetical protein KA831_07975 [Pyrinomonadaceae bacterium]|nr:hypothetical protein [Pyrinomonadaceae bacterium]
MKICPKCQKTYTDQNLNFCLDDGTVLTQAAGDAMPETVLLNQPRVTSPSQSAPSSFPGQQAQQPQQPGWNTAPQPYSMQPPAKSSKTWIWVLLILGVLVLVCGGGGLGALIYIGSQADKTSNSTTNTNNAKTSPSPTFGDKNPPTNSTSTSTRTNVKKVDIEKWLNPNSLYADSEYTNGELMLTSKQKKFYYVLAAPDDSDFKSENADISVTVRNVDAADSSLGYGLVFHSNPTPLQQGYAFLINTKTKKYHVVNHVPGDEKNVVSWTKSDAIKEGSQENVLEVRDISKDKIDLYINGTLVTSIKNVYGYAGGVVGLYSGDKVKVGFKNLEIRK